MRKGKLLIVSGPSGTGKSTVLHALMEGRDDLCFSISATTRKAREGETDGVHYHFLTEETFRQWIAEGAFLEYAEYTGNFYGTPEKFVDEAAAAGRDVLLDIDVQGAEQVRRKRPDAVSVFLFPPSWAELERRLTGRGAGGAEQTRKRLLRAREELQSARSYQYFVINDKVENAVRELSAILTAEHCRTEERADHILRLSRDE